MLRLSHSLLHSVCKQAKLFAKFENRQNESKKNQTAKYFSFPSDIKIGKFRIFPKKFSFKNLSKFFIFFFQPQTAGFITVDLIDKTLLVLF